MVAKSKQTQKDLYETDYNLWVVETVKTLEKQKWDFVDWENLIEEVSDLSRRSKKKLKSLLRNLLEHLLKISYWQTEIPRNQSHWKGEIRNFRKQIKDELEDSPSLKNYLHDILEECYQDAKEIVSDKSQLPLDEFPKSSVAPLDQVLDENWLPPRKKSNE